MPVWLCVPVEELLPDPVCVRLGVWNAEGVWEAVMDGVAVRVVVEVLDQGVPVCVMDLVLDAVVVRLPVIEAVIVALSEGVRRALGVCVLVEEPVTVAVLDAEPVRLGVRVTRAETVVD